MSVRRRKFSPPTIPRSRRRTSVRQEIIEPVLGFESRTEPQFMQPGQTPKSKNFINEERYLRVRSGLSQYGTIPYSSASTAFVLGSFINSNSLEETQIAAFHWAAASGGSNVSFFLKEPGSDWVVVEENSANSMLIDTRYGDYAETFLPVAPSGNARKMIVFTTEGEPGFFLPDDNGSGNYLEGLGSEANADFDYFDVEAKSHRYVESFDERLVFFHEIDSSSRTKSTRVRWSARGDPVNFSDGGSQDLVSMRGSGTGLIATEDRLLLFSDRDVWQATPRRDAFAFDFDQLTEEVGCPYPRSIAETSAGIIWLGTGRQLYLLSGGRIFKIGSELRIDLKNSVGFDNTDSVWATYDRENQQYQLHFTDSNAWYLDVTTLEPDRRDPDQLKGVWYEQDYGDHELLHGIPIRTQSTPLFTPAWTTLQLSSDRTPYIFESDQTTDDGTAFEAFWRSHAMRPSRGADDIQQEAITDFWIDYDARGSDSSVTVVYDENHNLMSQSVIVGPGTKFETSHLSGVEPGLAHIPFTSPAHRFPQFEVRLYNIRQRTRINRFQLTLRSYSGRFDG